MKLELNWIDYAWFVGIIIVFFTFKVILFAKQAENTKKVLDELDNSPNVQKILNMNGERFTLKKENQKNKGKEKSIVKQDYIG